MDASRCFHDVLNLATPLCVCVCVSVLALFSGQLSSLLMVKDLQQIHIYLLSAELKRISLSQLFQPWPQGSLLLAPLESCTHP